MTDTRALHPVSDPTDGRTASEAVLFEIRRVIVGQDAMLERVLVALLAGGHLLLEGVPGLAKTLTVRTLADVLDASFHRIQFTPDLVPADLVGTRIYRPDKSTFDTELGPVFCNFLLADEINRAPAKVQSALLEVMQERQVTIGPETFTVPRPFLVMATQNPIEAEGTYPLPEAQVDRFMMKVRVDYPSAVEEAVVVERSLGAAADITPILTADDLSNLQALTAKVYVDREIVDYAVALTRATREPAQVGLPGVAPYIAYGARLDQSHPCGARAGGRPRPALRPADRCDRPIPGCAASPDRAELHGPRRGSLGRHDPRPDHAGSAGPAAGRDGADGMIAVLTRDRPKERPGPGPTPVALLRALDLTIGRRIHGALPGEFRAHDLGGGLELAQVRPYQPGDDVRRIDWNVTARTTVPHIRVHVPERALTSWLLLDVSPSMTFGTALRRKADVAEGVALAIGHLATQRGNRLGIVTFGGRNDRRVPPRVGRDGLLATLLLAAGDDDSPADPSRVTSPAAALRFVAATARRGGLVVLASDFRGPRDWLRPLAAVAARHQVLAIEIDDPREGDLPDVGELTLVDAESGREVRVDTSSPRLRDRFRDAASTERADVARELRRMGVRHVVLSTATPWLASLAAQLRALGRAS